MVAPELDPAAPKPLSTSRKVTLALVSVGISVLFILAVGEVAVRILGLGVELYDNADPVLGHRFKRNLDLQAYEMGTRLHYRTNSLGFRGPEPRAVKDRPRVVFVGDSFTAGSDWHEEETFPRLVEKALDVEVINLGVPAYDTGTELTALTHVGLPLKPDVVVLCIYTGNDIRENSREMGTLPRPTFSLDAQGALVPHPFTPRGERLGQWLLGRSALYAWQKHEVRRLMFRARAGARGGDPMHEVYATREDPRWTTAWLVTEALLARMRDTVEQAGATLRIFVIPDVVQVDDDAWTALVAQSPSLGALQRDLPQQRLLEIAARQKLIMVDLLPTLRAAGRALDKEDPLYHGHLVRRGHATVTPVMVETLRGVLPAAK